MIRRFFCRLGLHLKTQKRDYARAQVVEYCSICLKIFRLHKHRFQMREIKQLAAGTEIAYELRCECGEVMSHQTRIRRNENNENENNEVES